MISFHTYCQIREFHNQRLSHQEIAVKLSLDPRTVSKWKKRDCYQSRKRTNRSSILDPYKLSIRREVELTQCSAIDVFRSLRVQGYSGGYTTVKGFVAVLRTISSERSVVLPDFWMLMLLQGRIAAPQLVQELGGKLVLEDAEIFIAHLREGKLNERNRALSVLADFKGLAVRQIRDFLMIDERTIRGYQARYREQGARGLFAFRSEIPRKHEQIEYKELLFSILHAPPRDYDINRTSWKMADLHRVMSEQGLPINKTAIRAIIRDAGFQFRKAKQVLTSTDPKYRDKLKVITAILSNLSESESFFSIDEFGPFAVRRQGGRALTGPGQERVVPQWQKSKGSLTLVGALELSTNQITHFYANRKSTAEMIQLLHVLLSQYHEQERLFLSWDAASWHGSKRFENEVERVNTDSYRTTKGTPAVTLAPLPSCAQFLNVIESVFSGMARAIIHNSDYQSIEECKDAIDRYFLERNKYFEAHPKRAGNKIWGKERGLPVFSESNNCKDPMYR